MAKKCCTYVVPAFFHSIFKISLKTPKNQLFFEIIAATGFLSLLKTLKHYFYPIIEHNLN